MASQGYVDAYMHVADLSQALSTLKQRLKRSKKGQPKDKKNDFTIDLKIRLAAEPKPGFSPGFSAHSIPHMYAGATTQTTALPSLMTPSTSMLASSVLEMKRSQCIKPVSPTPISWGVRMPTMGIMMPSKKMSINELVS